MTRKLRRQGIRTVAITDPAVKDDPNFPVFQRGMQREAFVREADGKTDYQGEVWPGIVRFPDFLNSEVRTWWGEEQRTLLEQGVAGIWNDMNEPANFARPDKTLPPMRCTGRIGGRNPMLPCTIFTGRPWHRLREKVS